VALESGFGSNYALTGWAPPASTFPQLFESGPGAFVRSDRNEINTSRAALSMQGARGFESLGDHGRNRAVGTRAYPQNSENFFSVRAGRGWRARVQSGAKGRCLHRSAVKPLRISRVRSPAIAARLHSGPNRNDRLSAHRPSPQRKWVPRSRADAMDAHGRPRNRTTFASSSPTCPATQSAGQHEFRFGSIAPFRTDSLRTRRR
jgi:hypothetical protein